MMNHPTDLRANHNKLCTRGGVFVCLGDSWQLFVPFLNSGAETIPVQCKAWRQRDEPGAHKQQWQGGNDGVIMHRLDTPTKVRNKIVLTHISFKSLRRLAPRQSLLSLFL